MIWIEKHLTVKTIMKLSQKVIDEISDVYWEMRWLKSLLVKGGYGDEDSLLYPQPQPLDKRPSVPRDRKSVV